MTFWLTTKTLTKLVPLAAGYDGYREFYGVSVSVRVPCGVTRESFSRP